MIIFEKYRGIYEANFRVKGGIVTGAPTSSPFEGLVGKVITFSAPAGTCTFTQPVGGPLGQLTFAEVKAQLEAAIAGLIVETVNGHLGFRHATAAVALAAVDETGRAPLGFENNAAVSGVLLLSNASPKFLTFEFDNETVIVAYEVV